MSKDVTDRENIRNLVRASQSEFVNMLVNTAPMCFFVVDHSRTMIYANDEFKERSGLDDARIVGRKCYALCGLADICPNCRLDEAMETMRESSTYRDDTQKLDIRHSDCHIIPLAAEGPGGDVVFLELIFDLTQEVELEKRLEQDFERTLDMLLFVLRRQEVDIYEYSKQIADISLELGKRLNLPEKSLEKLRLAALLHDIGRIAFIKHEESETPIAMTDCNRASASAEILAKMNPFHEIATIVRAMYDDYTVDANALLESRILRVASVATQMWEGDFFQVDTAEADRIKRHLQEGSGSRYHPEVAKAMGAFLDSRS